MPTSPYFPSYYGGTTGEQGLVQDLVDEQIKLFGTDIYYLPRTLITDGVLDDVIYNKFESQFQVEMLLQNVEGFGSPSEFISKFGLRITDEVRFVVSQRRWEEASAGSTLTVPARPNEGDLLYFPLTKDIYEIKFVEREDPFYQLGKLYFYTMTAEIYEYGSDDISTGVDEIDVLETIMSPAILMFMDPGGIGNFSVGEEVVGVLCNIFDPEIPVDIYQLGLIYDVQVSTERDVHILMTLTSPNCPVAESLPQEVKEKSRALDSVNDVEVEITFEPPWDKSMMSEEAKLELGML